MDRMRGKKITKIERKRKRERQDRESVWKGGKGLRDR